MVGELDNVLEPLGHRSAYSKIERYWATVTRPQALERHRTSVFDVEACMSMAPMRYIGQPLTFRSELPDDDWIVATLTSFVRGEFPARTSRTEPLGMPNLKHREVGAEFLQEFLANSERLDPILKQTGSSNNPRQMAETIYELLCDPRVGSKRNRRNNKVESFIADLVATIERESRLLFILPGFPFKDQNRFRVPYRAEEPDLADISFLIRLHRLTQALYQVHPYGADVLILSDGSLYGDLFGVSQESVDRYSHRLRGYRNQLNLQGTISSIPLRDLMAKPDTRGLVPLDLSEEVENRLRRLYVSMPDLSDVFADLKAGIKRNMNSSDLLSDVDSEMARAIIYSPEPPGAPSMAKRWLQFDHLSENAAIRYAAANLTLKWLDIIMSHFPGSIRGTVHPKPGQFALAGSGGAYAWNGVALSNGWPRSIDDVKVSPFFALADHPSVVQVSFHDGLPAFFMPDVE